MPIDFNVIQEKTRSLYNLKWKEGEGSKAGEFKTNKVWFDNFRKRLGLKNIQITGEAPSSDQEETGELPDAMKKIIEEGNLPEHVFNADRSTLFWKKKFYQGDLLLSKRIEHQNSRQEGIG